MARPTLPSTAVKAVLDHLDPYLETLQSGFPTSTRPNELPLTAEQKRDRITSTLERDPALFLSKWGSVLLYPPPPPPSLTSSPSQSTDTPSPETVGKSSAAKGLNTEDQQVPQQQKAESLTASLQQHQQQPPPSQQQQALSDGIAHLQAARALLDLFRPLAPTDYEIRTYLHQLDRQWAQLYEREQFRRRRQQAAAAAHQSHHDHDQQDQNEHASRSTTTTTTSAQEGGKDRRTLQTKSDQQQLLAWSTVSETTRKNRRLNYLLRTLAPPDPAVVGSGAAAVAATGVERGSLASGRASASVSSSSSSSAAGLHAGRRASLDQPTATSPSTATTAPTRISLAQMTSLSGSMANLSFSDSTYFSDAEMEARAPELYHQYIGRFLDQDSDEDDEDESDEDESEEDGEDGEHGQKHSQRRDKGMPLGENADLVDRLMLSVDRSMREHDRKEQREKRKQKEQQEQREKARCEAMSNTKSSSQTSSFQRHQQVQSGFKNEDEEFEEEFDTESEVEDEAEMMDVQDAEDLAATRKIMHDMSMTPELPPQKKVRGTMEAKAAQFGNNGSSKRLDNNERTLALTMATAASTLEQPEARARLAQVANGNDSGDDASEDEELLKRKDYQEALRQEFLVLMKQRFIDGLDETFDYSTVDYDEDLDDLEQQAHDDEDRWFDEDEEEEVGEEDRDEEMEGEEMGDKVPGSSSASGTSKMKKPNIRWDYEARMRESPKNMDDYDY
ncbi:hypothetical protein BGW42_007134 [Actinomortierella wolfii]|nr:hypothetical protein BGW42_007134 [Actinomortierella wolfii]